MPHIRAYAADISNGLDRTTRAIAVGAFSLLAVHWLLLLSFVVPRLGRLDFLRLHYTASHGIDWVGDWRQIFVFPAIGLGAFFCNLWFAGALGRRERTLSRMLMAATLLIEAALAAGGVAAILLNG